MKVIFLDVDGVLNSMAYYQNVTDVFEEAIDPDKVKNLARIVEETGANIVLTSSWRGGWEKDILQCGEDGAILTRALAQEKLTIFDKTGASSVYRREGRSLEVLEWMKLCPKLYGEKVEQFVIIDDNDFGWAKHNLDAYWVETDFLGPALDQAHTDAAIEILNRPVKRKMIFLVEQDYKKFYDGLIAKLGLKPELMSLIKKVNKLITLFMYLAYPLTVAWMIYQRDLRVIKVILVPGIFFVLVSFFRKKINRKRPYETWEIDNLIKKDTKGQSMPSRHVFSSTIISMAFCFLCWPIGVICLGLSALEAVIRVVGGVHYPSDVVVGYVVGILSGLLIFIL
ncbi:MAG: HAD domain-containing protein [Lachnospiraceae bacterium]|nr:HAD domain-containing protein [Lachnospiraceae bacterium]